MRIAEAFGMAESEVRLMGVAGNVHDLGKLAVPNAILEKPDTLSEGEFQVMKKHAYLSYAVLNTIGGLRQLPEWAAFHHERLDGEGYPHHLSSDRLDTGARVLAISDVFTALAEDRPYRKGMDDEKIAEILTRMGSNGKLDQRIVEVLLDNTRDIRLGVQEQQSAVLSFYETEFPSAPCAT